jgi:hypothetical protein
MSVREEIVNMINAFIVANDEKAPTRVHMTPTKTNQLFVEDGFPMDKDPREVYKDGILGLTPIWEAEDYKVE